MRIVFSTGDIHGIGPEIILKSFMKLQESDHTFLVTGSCKVMEYYRERLDLPVKLKPVTDITALDDVPANKNGTLPVLSVAEPNIIQPGTLSAEAGKTAMLSLETAAKLCQSGVCDALVTAPIHKEAIALAGYHETGHTGFLAGMFPKSSPIMMFFDPVSKLRVALATIHEPLAKVPELIRTMDLDAFFLQLADALRKDFLIERPKTAVLGLNPHASDGGVMGSEEKEIILPCIERLSSRLRIDGPFPADGFFGAGKYRHYDIVVAMYHDQGLLPFKVLAFDTGINVTLGLPIVRTSPDHGTSFDIAGRGIASERSFYEAVLLALNIAQNRTTIPAP
ncbi:MAG: 4-hydroxythreonine-4-phosphate dehydrogenase PdxA [Chlorobiaceae bacterium]|jgi:4-hydroxythreonine-4-phosphate dehydrogenase|nr:4-hydroxythreonine-4-phosphate dehydrogenase PdxA [Chlorobiaceae bacterium]NTW63313.1 4-hydroxythreonine-4-phosphate dehydrogenase PdxA [Chlorobiaceae bacterium]